MIQEIPKAHPRVRPYHVPNSLDPACDTCPRGAGLSLTVLFFGVGERSFLSKTVRYSRRESRFPSALAAALVRGPHDCCRTELLLVKHDAASTIGENAAAAAARIDAIIKRAVKRYDWLLKINLHIVGFSAGGLLALDTASRIDVSTRVRTKQWCGNEMPREVPVEMDLVTMATPFNLSITIASTIVTGLPWTYESSVGASEYRAPAPDKVCSFTALVSSARHGDETAGADRDPSADPRLNALLSGLNPTKKRIVKLRDTYRPNDPDDAKDPQHVSHLEVLEKSLADFPWALVPRCSCVQTF